MQYSIYSNCLILNSGHPMSRKKLRIHRTQLDNLISNLRGEVGEVISTWVLWRNIQAMTEERSSSDINKDFSDRGLITLSVLANKLYDEMIARLSELAEDKVGRLNFHFAAKKLNALHSEAMKFSNFIGSRRFKKKRNYDVSHKELPESWSDHKDIKIQYPDLLRAITMALRLMKKIDRIVLGPSSLYLWREMRKRRYNFMHPARISYMLLPYYSLSPEVREKIVQEEEKEGRQVWTDMETKVNGRPAKIRVAKKWGIIDLSSIKYLDGRK